MTIERLAPDAILLETNLTGPVSRIQDDPDSPDANWLTANSDGADTYLRVSFPTPHASPTVGAGLQEFRVRARRSGASLTPTVQLSVYEGGVLRLAGSVENVTTDSVHALTWNASLLTDPTGAGVEVRAFGNHASFLFSDATVEIGAVEWNAAEAAIPYAGSSGSSGSSSSALLASASYAGSSGSSGAGAGAATFSADYSGSNGSDGASVSAAAVPTTARGSSGSSGTFVAESIPVADYVGSSGSSGAAEDTPTTLIGGVGSSGSSGIFMAQSLQGLVALGSSGSSGAYTADVEQFTANVGSSGSSGSYTPTVDFCLGDDERLPPDAILEQTNLVGTVSDIDDDPDSPDGSWLETPLLGLLLPTSVRTSFPTPSVDLGCSEDGCVPGEPVISDTFNRLVDVPCPNGQLGLADTLQNWTNRSGALVTNAGAAQACTDVTPNRASIEDPALVGVPRTVRSRVFLSPELGVGDFPKVNVGLQLGFNPVGFTSVYAEFNGNGTLGMLLNLIFSGLPGMPTDVITLSSKLGGDFVDLEIRLTETSIDVLVDDVVTISQSITPTQFATVAALPTVGIQSYIDANLGSPGDDGQSRFLDFQAAPCVSSGGTQEFRALVRSTVLGIPPPLGLLAPTVRLELWESGVLVDASPEFAVNSDTGEVISWTWDPALLSDPTGAGVEARLVGTPAILGEVGWTVEPGALEWNAASCSGCRYHGSGGSDGTYTPSVAMSADYAGSSGSGGATQTFIVTGSAYAGSSGSSGSSDTRTLRFADYLGSSGSSGHQTAPACGVVDGSSQLLDVCEVSGP